MNVRIAVIALAAVSVLGACQKDGETKSGGTVKPAVSSNSTAPTTATTAAPSSTTATMAKATTTTTSKPTTTTERATTTTSRPATTVSYANCDAVRAAGKAPLYEGEPGYAPKLDRDHDGIACE